MVGVDALLQRDLPRFAVSYGARRATEFLAERSSVVKLKNLMVIKAVVCLGFGP